MLVHHTGKETYKTGKQVFKGNQSILDNSDMLMYLSRPNAKDEKSRPSAKAQTILFQEKNRGNGEYQNTAAEMFFYK